ncbi:MAG: peptidoglycan DD-metalloendopeptidase family protein [Verrucomicrobiota bacterium]
MRTIKLFLSVLVICGFSCYTAKPDQTREGLSNGSFENGSASWSFGYYAGGATTSSGAFQGANAYAGQWYAYLGDQSTSAPSSADGYMYQYIFPRPETNALAVDVSFYFNATSQDTGSIVHDTLSVYLRVFDDNLNFLYDVPIFFFSNKDREVDGNPKTYHLMQVSYDLTQGVAGHWMTLLFKVKTDSTYGTTFRIDNISAKVRTPDPIFTVTPSAGTGGTIYPSTTQTVVSNGSISFTASPNATNNVDQWFVGGVAKQNGGTSFVLTTVTSNTSINVTFKIKTYALNISAAHGSVAVAPQLSSYPHGGEVTITAYPLANYWLYDWRGDLSGVGNTLRFRVTKDTSIQANFQLISQPISIQIAQSTPATGFQITIPPASQMLHLFQCSDDMFCWRNLCVYDGNQANTATISSITGGLQAGFFRTVDVPVITTQPFLSFPVRNMTSRTAPVSSVFDHAGPFNQPDGAILTYKGELVRINASNGWQNDGEVKQRASNDPNNPTYFKKYKIVGYDRDPSHMQSMVFTSLDNNILWYDGHNGYDYAVSANEDVLAAASGYVVPSESSACYNAICIDHGNGYRTYYLHLSERAPELMLNGLVQPVFVNAGQLIGHPGGVACPNGVKVHLHFEVKRNNNGSWTAIDPYGNNAENGANFEPELWLPGQ